MSLFFAVTNNGGIPGALGGTTRPAAGYFPGMLWYKDDGSQLSQWNGAAWVDFIPAGGFVPSTRTINTTLPLAGGGDLSANRTFSITGLSTLGTANQIPGTNAAANAWEYKTVGAGSAGSDFAVAFAAGSITYNLPDASTVNRGAVTVGTQTFGGAKTFNSAVTLNSTLTATTAVAGVVPFINSSKQIVVNDTTNLFLDLANPKKLGIFIASPTNALELQRDSTSISGQGTMAFIKDTRTSGTNRFAGYAFANNVITGSFNAMTNNVAAPYNSIDGIYFRAVQDGVPFFFTTNSGGTEEKSLSMFNNGNVKIDRVAPNTDNGFKLEVAGTFKATSLKTADPGAGAGVWKLGTLVTAAVTADTTRYLQVDVGGVLYKVIIST